MFSEEGLDPSDWQAFRAQAHRMLDDILDFTQHIGTSRIWQAMPDAPLQALRSPLPRRPSPLVDVHQQFMRDVLPYHGGNTHPGFMGWVQGGGTPVGMLAEMLAGGLNANLGGRHHAPIEVEKQILTWMRSLFAFPDTASGLFVTGSSMATLMAVLIARRAACGPAVRMHGLRNDAGKLVAYTSEEAHACVAKAMDLSGLGTAALRRIPSNQAHRMDLQALKGQLAQDLSDGLTPFLLIGSAGTVDTGAIDELPQLAQLCRRQAMWFHVDGAYGALGKLSPDIAPLLAGIELADSIAFDFHKWGQVPYDAGYLLVRDGQTHQDAFAAPAAYLHRESRGMSAGAAWPCDFGPDLSRGFRALKTWVTFKVYGADRLGDIIARTCALAQAMASLIEREPRLELLAPVALNIVCFRYRSDRADAVNNEIVIRLQESGPCAPSSTRIRGQLAIRAAIVNHRTTLTDVQSLIEATLALGEQLSAAD